MPGRLSPLRTVGCSIRIAARAGGAATMEPKHFVSITVSAIYSYFVVAAWLPLYLLLYWLPRP